MGHLSGATALFTLFSFGEGQHPYSTNVVEVDFIVYSHIDYPKLKKVLYLPFTGNTEVSRCGLSSLDSS